MQFAPYTSLSGRYGQTSHTRNVFTGFNAKKRGFAATAVTTASALYNTYNPNKKRKFRPSSDMPRPPRGHRVVRRTTRRNRFGNRLIPASRSRQFNMRKRAVSRRRTGFVRKSRTFKKTSRFKGRKKFKSNAMSGLNQHLYRSLCTPMSWKQTLSSSVAGVQGQRMWVWIPISTNADLEAFVAQRKGNYMVPSSFTAAGASVSNFGGNTGTLCVDRYTKSIQFQNRANTDMHLKLYTLKPRFDLSSTDFSYATNVFQSQAASDDTQAFDQGPNQVTNPTGLTQKWQYPNYTPYMTTEITASWKIMKTDSVVIPSNQYVSRTYRTGKHCANVEKVLFTGINYYRKHSYVVLATWIGQQVDDGVLGNNNQTTSKNDLYYKTDFTADYHFMPKTDLLYDISAPSTNNEGNTSSFKVNPAAFVAVAPSEIIVETTVTAENLSTGVSVPTDQAPQQSTS